MFSNKYIIGNNIRVWKTECCSCKWEAEAVFINWKQTKTCKFELNYGTYRKISTMPLPFLYIHKVLFMCVVNTPGHSFSLFWLKQKKNRKQTYSEYSHDDVSSTEGIQQTD